MKSPSSLSPFRVFGSPYTFVLHQHVAYLRLKQLPFKVYCTNFSTTLLYSLYYRARGSFCTLTPSGTSCVQVWQLAEAVELDEDVEAIARRAKGDVTYTASGDSHPDPQAAVAGASPAAPARTQRMMVSRDTHPHLHLASWCVVVYACWWLVKTGAMYRYIKGESLDLLEGYVRYFFIGGIGFARLMAPQFRQMTKIMAGATGVSEATAPFMDEHFMRFCTALEAHLQQHPNEPFLLCTPHPTLADVTLGAAFSSYFLADDPPSSILAEKFPCVTEYVERVTGWRGATFVGTTESAAPADPQATGDAGGASEDGEGDGGGAGATASGHEGSSRDYPDVVPESLAGCFELMAEVFPFLMSQTASFSAYMASDAVRTLRREKLDGPWEGCEGYLLPQVAKIQSLMIIDDNVSTVLVRAQDLELAFLAAREVHDLTLRQFGRQDDRLDTAPPSTETPPAVAPSCSTAEVSAGEGAAEGERGGAVAPVEETEEGAAALPTSPLDRAMDITRLDPQDADFYRTFTRAGQQRVAGTSTTLTDKLPRARNATSSTAAQALVHRSSVMEHLGTLRTMLAKMACPQYTLTTVFRGRRVYVAVIPEHEVAKARKARQEKGREKGTAA